MIGSFDMASITTMLLLGVRCEPVNLIGYSSSLTEFLLENHRPSLFFLHTQFLSTILSTSSKSIYQSSRKCLASKQQLYST